MTSNCRKPTALQTISNSGKPTALRHRTIGKPTALRSRTTRNGFTISKDRESTGLRSRAVGKQRIHDIEGQETNGFTISDNRKPAALRHRMIGNRPLYRLQRNKRRNVLIVDSSSTGHIDGRTFPDRIDLCSAKSARKIVPCNLLEVVPSRRPPPEDNRAKTR